MDWFDNERYWSTFDSYIFPPERMNAAEGEVDQLIALSGVTGGTVLDLCCGPGRHLVALARRGFAATGVDRSASLLARANAYARDSGVRVDLVQQDVRAFVRTGTFDLAVNLFTSFGYFDDDGDQRRMLKNVFTSLRPGGTFVMELMGKEVLARVHQPTWSTRTHDGTLVVARSEIVRGWTRVRNEWIAIVDDAAQTFEFEHWVYSGRELAAMLESAGFVNLRLAGDLTGRDYGAHATRLVAVARTPAS